MAVRPAFIPTGAAIVGTYGPNVAPSNMGRGGATAPRGAVRVAGPEHVPEFVPDPRHCQWVVDENQCRSWPVRKDGIDNPQRYCAGHLKKANNGAEPTADQGLRTDVA